MAINFKSFAAQNWAITPVALAVNEAKPATIGLQKWHVVLTGVGVIDFQGNNVDDWRRDTLSIFPSIITPALQSAISRYNIPVPDPAQAHMAFELDQWAPFAAPSSTFSRETGTVDAGFAVDQWAPAPFNFGTDVISSSQVKQVFNGINVDIAVRNNLATLHRVSYHITLVGRIVFLLQV
jgi:hypothetical protein